VNSATTSAPTAPHLAGPSRTSAVYDPAAWLRLPRPGFRCETSGLSRQTLVELVRPCARNGYRPPVEAKHLKRQGTTRGIVLVSRASLLAYLDGLPTVAESCAADGEKGGDADE
jgi:hypothetical protein